MRELIDSTINWDKISTHKKSEYKYSVEKAVISKESSALNICLRLNFVIPFLDVERIKGLILNKITQLSDVEFHFIYEDVILEEKEIVNLFIAHMIHIVNGIISVKKS